MSLGTYLPVASRSFMQALREWREKSSYRRGKTQRKVNKRDGMLLAHKRLCPNKISGVEEVYRFPERLPPTVDEFVAAIRDLGPEGIYEFIDWEKYREFTASIFPKEVRR